MGVPQGSMLGPILFTLYLNDLENKISLNVACNMHADDTSLIMSDINKKLLPK